MKVVVLGAGPAGMMAAYQSALRGLDTEVWDPNEKQGRKLRLTGKGRCNVCNDCDVKTVIANTTVNGKFLYSALNRFPPWEVINFFENNGVPLKTERGNRVFPQSDSAHDVADAMVRLCRGTGVRFVRKKAKSLEEISADAVIIATGGLSYPLTGSTGDGYRFAKSVGHTIVDPRASLVPLESDEPYLPALQGFAPKNVVFRLYENDTLIYKELGEMLFTHFGISGPVVLSSSAHIHDAACCRAEIDFKPALDDRKLDERLLRDFSENAGKYVVNYLPSLTGKSMAPVVAELAGIPDNLRICEMPQSLRASLRRVLKAFPVNITGLRPIDEAIITKGGVAVSEVNPRTMQSKLNDRIYFAGEVLDVDAYTGGFNLQIAWSTGFVAGREVLNG